MTEVMVTSEAVRSAQLQSGTTNIPASNCLHAKCPFCHPTNSVRALNGKVSHSMDLLTLTHLATFYQHVSLSLHCLCNPFKNIFTVKLKLTAARLHAVVTV